VKTTSRVIVRPASIRVLYNRNVQSPRSGSVRLLGRVDFGLNRGKSPKISLVLIHHTGWAGVSIGESRIRWIFAIATAAALKAGLSRHESAKCFGSRRANGLGPSRRPFSGGLASGRKPSASLSGPWRGHRRAARSSLEDDRAGDAPPGRWGGPRGPGSQALTHRGRGIGFGGSLGLWK
jgi:hypothetical protein